MRDALEEHLANRLGTLGEAVGDDLPPPVDLELQVQRRRRHTRARRRGASLLIVAAVVVGAAAVVATVNGSTGHNSVRIESSSTTAAPRPIRDSLQRGTVMLAARGHDVISLDAGGHTNATMVTVTGDIQYARATADHRELWYLSMKGGTKGCAAVVRADIDGRTSKIVTYATTFDVSPDGSRLALYGSGDLAGGHCAPVRAGANGRVVVVDPTGSASSAVTMGDVTALRWSPDGSFLAVARCGAFQCGFQRIDVPPVLGAPLVATAGTSIGFARVPAGSQESIVFGPDGLYELARTVSSPVPSPGATAPAPIATETVERYDSRTLGSAVLVFSGGTGWNLTQVVPTPEAVYLVATPLSAAADSTHVGQSGLYRVESGRLAFVRSLDSPGNLTPVMPLSAG